jgi:hypothetical protein
LATHDRHATNQKQCDSNIASYMRP